MARLVGTALYLRLRRHISRPHSAALLGDVAMEFMTIAEMRDMTRLKIGSAIARWFAAQGITYKMGTDGYPVVLKSHVESVLSGLGGHRTVDRKRSSPNFEALKKRLHGHGTQAQQ